MYLIGNEFFSFNSYIDTLNESLHVNGIFYFKYVSKLKNMCDTAIFCAKILYM